MLSPEQLREHWKTLKAPACFDPDQPNWTDLTVQEIGEALKPSFRDFSGLLPGSDLPKYTPIAKDQLPLIPASYYPAISVDDSFDQWEGSSQIRQALPFLDPEDKLYYSGVGHRSHSSYIFMRHWGSLNSCFWEKYWGLQLDIAVYVKDLEGDEMKMRSLIPPQNVRSQHSSPLYPEIHITSREALGKNHPWIDNEARPAIAAGPWLLYSKQLIVPRNGQYPFNDETRQKVASAAAQVITKDALYDDLYRYQINQAYYYARYFKIELPGAFAAQEV